jgi:hypothetical protein
MGRIHVKCTLDRQNLTGVADEVEPGDSYSISSEYNPRFLVHEVPADTEQ